MHNPARGALIVIPLALPISWSADYEFRTAELLSETNDVILIDVSEGMTLRRLLIRPRPVIERLKERLYVFRPIYPIPLQRFEQVKSINMRFAMSQLRRIIRTRETWRNRKKIFWSFSLQYAVFLHHLGREYFSVYDCVDAFVSEDPRLNARWNRYERTLVSEADAVFANQATLKKRIGTLHPQVSVSRIGFHLDLFEGMGEEVEPSDMTGIPRPRIVFAGNINARLDFGLLKRLIPAMSGYSFVFIGAEDASYTGVPGTDFTEEIRTLKLLSNVHFLGLKKKSEIPGYLAHADIGLIPYDLSQRFNKACFPMKTLEYFYLGKPVVSTGITELTKLAPYVSVIENAQQAERTIRKLASRPWPAAYKRAQVRFAAHHSFRNKIRVIRQTLRQNHGVTI